MLLVRITRMFQVAPRAGARIETLCLVRGRLQAVSLPVRGRGLKHEVAIRHMECYCRSPCGGAD